MSTAAGPRLSTSEPAPVPAGRPPSRFEALSAKYREDHTHPVNHILHVWVGWPICAFGVVALPFRPWWTVAAFALGYAFMWFGHFVFEGNLPTIFRHPTTPFVMAWSVTRALVVGAFRLVSPGRGTPP